MLFAKERIHGGNLPSADILDFSVNLNTYGPSPRVLEAVRNANITHYPDPQGDHLAEAIGKYLDRPGHSILLASGACDIFWNLARLFGRQGHHRTLIMEPTFCEWGAAAAQAGLALTSWWPEYPVPSAFNIDNLHSALADADDQGSPFHSVYLCNPNSPTGLFTRLSEIGALALEFPDTWFILDEAFLNLSHQAAELWTALPDNVLRVRSLTKDHAIAGLRLGYTLAPKDLVKQLKDMRPSWSISSPALAAGYALLTDDDFIAKTRTAVLADTAYLFDQLTSLGFEVLPSKTVFLLATHPRPDFDGDRVMQELLRKGILIRSCASYGLPRYIRLAGRQKPDVDRLISTLREVYR